MLKIRYTDAMKQVLLLLSIFMLLSSNIAMAVDFDCYVLQQNDSFTSLDNIQDLNHNTPESNGDDSCHSHISSHFVGIYPDTINSYLASTSNYIAIPVSFPSSQIVQPATPPPNA